MISWSHRWSDLALVLAPWAGVGVVVASTGRSLGAGIQPAYLPLLALVTLAAVDTFRRRDAGGVGSWTIALAWTLLTTCALWTRDIVGLAGDVPWTKGLKQFVLLAFFVVVAAAFARLAQRGGLRRLETATTLGLGAAVMVALVQAVTFHGGIAGGGWFERLISSNPSIASGSAELYLGDRFVGIPRVRGPFPEPLHFGSYLIAAVPLAAAGAWVHRGSARAWRAVVAAAGALCLVLTFSRGAWLGAGVVGITLVVGMGRGVLPRPAGRTLILVGAGAVIVGVIASPVLTGHGAHEIPGLLLQRVQQSFAGHDMSNLTRFWSWRVAFDLFLERPLQGVGWGGFGFWYFERAGLEGGGAHFGWPVVNSLPLQILAEVGLVGFVLWCASLAPGLRALVLRRPSAEAYLVAAVVGGVLVHLLTFSQWDLPHLWILFGVAVGTGSRIPQVV